MTGSKVLPSGQVNDSEQWENKLFHAGEKWIPHLRNTHLTLVESTLFMRKYLALDSELHTELDDSDPQEKKRNRIRERDVLYKFMAEWQRSSTCRDLSKRLS